MTWTINFRATPAHELIDLMHENGKSARFKCRRTLMRLTESTVRENPAAGRAVAPDCIFGAHS